MDSSTPSISQFYPHIEYQFKLIKDIRKHYDYSLGTHEILLSGSVGSAKSTVAAHLAVTHCLFNPNARLAICRRALPDIKRTIFLKILEHIGQDLKEGKDYSVNTTLGVIKFSNGSEIISLSWADKRYVKVRSVDLSAAIFEEIIENTGDDIQAYTEIKMRVGRLPHIKEKWIVSCTNPDSPSSHWYDYFFVKESKTKHIFLSRTEDNPFLPKEYIEQLKLDLDPKMARRMIYGEWVELDKSRVYYAYESSRNLINKPYEINKKYPIILSFDFNIGEGKPMSSVAMQYYNDTFHIFDEVVLLSARTADAMDEWNGKGYFNGEYEIVIHGDAAGKHKDTRNIQSDYDIIRKYLSNITSLKFRSEVPLANPAIRTRHNRVNAYCLNADSKVRLFVYQKAKTVDKALRLTQLKKGGDYIEDDGPSHPYQHIGTAVGYAIMSETNKPTRPMIESHRRF
jgi:hypothetical protein